MMKISAILTAALVALATSPAAANDYSPFDEATIKTVNFRDDGIGYVRIAVAITSKTDKPFDTMFECSLFDANDQPYATATGTADAVPPGQTIAADALIEEPVPKAVSCRLTDLLAR